MAIQVKQTVFGDGVYRECVSIRPLNKDELLEMICSAADTRADAIQIAVTQYEDVVSFPDDLAGCTGKAAGKAIIINTNAEGRKSNLTEEERIQLVHDSLEKAEIDAVDVPDDIADDELNRIRKLLDSTDTKLILSCYCLRGVPEQKEILERLEKMVLKKADMVRAFYLAQDDVDVITVACASKKFKEKYGQVPACVFAMGEAGFMLRILADRCGNDYGCYEMADESEDGLFESYSQYIRMRNIYKNQKVESRTKYSNNKEQMGGKHYLSCLMDKEGSREGVIRAAKDLLPNKPDLVEWRLDYFSPIADTDDSEREVLETLAELKGVLGNIPLLLCFRLKDEGGYRYLSRELRLRMNKACISTGMVGYVDLEMQNDQAFIDEIAEVCRENNTVLILSAHDWENVPDRDGIIAKFMEARDKGAGMPKLYLTANNYEDVVRLSETSRYVREELLDLPFNICAMGHKGLITRILGGDIGADFGFHASNCAKGGIEDDVIYYDQLLDVFGLEK